jgi:hypothetical protein
MVIQDIAASTLSATPNTVQTHVTHHKGSVQDLIDVNANAMVTNYCIQAYNVNYQYVLERIHPIPVHALETVPVLHQMHVIATLATLETRVNS